MKNNTLYLLRPIRDRLLNCNLRASGDLYSQALLSTDALATTPFLILGNKIDIPRAASDGESAPAATECWNGRVGASPWYKDELGRWKPFLGRAFLPPPFVSHLAITLDDGSSFWRGAHLPPALLRLLNSVGRRQ